MGDPLKRGLKSIRNKVPARNEKVAALSVYRFCGSGHAQRGIPLRSGMYIGVKSKPETSFSDALIRPREPLREGCGKQCAPGKEGL
jgi:hypothetical protein